MLEADTISRGDLEEIARPSLDPAKLSRDELVELARATVESSPWNLPALTDDDGDPDEPEVEPRLSGPVTPKRRTRTTGRKK